MKFLKKRSVTQKTVIVILTVLLLTFAIPKPVSAVTNILLSPIITLATSLLDGIQHILEWAMLGETTNFMKSIHNKNGYDAVDPPNVKQDNQNQDNQNQSGPTGDGRIWAENKDGEIIFSEDEIDGTLWGADAVNIPKIQYTPEEIFSNRVPALDINFIKPSVTTGTPEFDQKHNIAMQLQPVISSWYVAIRTLALVALLSVLVYLGIRMLITSIAADKAKYKKMIMDWIVGLCLLFVLHYIMSFALTMSEVVTSMLGQDTAQSINVAFENNGNTYAFSGNLMSYVRFMVQSTDTATGIGFFFLYLMLVIYTVRFTWIYLKRVANMAFLTMIAPFVALTYPIDKVSDGSAQAFNMWIKEFSFNALLQPLHLLLYKVLLGSATSLAVVNPLYAIVCLGFILAAEKLLKQMFGFNKATAGTVGSLAGAAGVTALASKALMGGAKKLMPSGGNQGKVRTNDKYQRQGKNPDAPKDLSSFNTDKGNAIPPPTEGDATNSDKDASGLDTTSPEQQNPADEAEQQPQKETLDDLEQQRAELYNQGYTDNSDEVAAINQRIQDGDFSEPPQNPDTSGSPDPAMTEEAIANIGTEQQRFEPKKGWNNIRRKMGATTHNTIQGIKAALPSAIYKGVRGGAKLAARGAAGLALGATAGVIAATNGNGEQAMAALGAGFGVGFATGDNLFEGTVGKVAKDVNVKETYGAAQYGSKTDYRNAMADKEFLKSDEFNDYYEKNFKGKGKSKKEIKEAFRSYREAGITDNGTIKKALALEDKYRKENTFNGDNEMLRQNIQEIVQSKDLIDTRAYRDDKWRANEINKIERSLTNIKDDKARRARAEQVFKGYQDFYDLG